MQEAKLHAVTGSSCEAILSTTLVFVILVSCRERYSNVTALQRPTHETYSDPKFALETGSNACCVFVVKCTPTNFQHDVTYPRLPESVILCPYSIFEKTDQNGNKISLRIRTADLLIRLGKTSEQH